MPYWTMVVNVFKRHFFNFVDQKVFHVSRINTPFLDFLILSYGNDFGKEGQSWRCASMKK